MLYTLSKIDHQKLEKINILEGEIGLRLLAFTEIDVAPANLEKMALKEIKALENELGLTLLAVN